MTCSVARFFLVVSLLPALAYAQTNQRVKRENSTGGPLRICQGVPIPEGYVIVAYETSSKCPHGAYVLKKEAAQSRFVPATQPASSQAAAPKTVAPQPAAPAATAASRPRKVNTPPLSDQGTPELATNNSPVFLRQPVLKSAPAATELSSTPLEKTDEEVSEGDVVRIETNFVTVPVSVLDRQGRFISDLRRDQFSLFENGVEQRIAHFEPTEKPFTVALVLDTSGSTLFHLWEIKEAAVAFAKQLRPQDRVLVVTFDEMVMLLTEATNDLKVVTEVIQQNARTGFSTRLYDAVDLVIKERLNKIEGRKAIVLFTDGLDTASYQATYQGTLGNVDEQDVLIYPIQYDTRDTPGQRPSNVTIVTNNSGSWPFPSRSTSQVIYSNPTVQGPTKEDYERADQYLHQLADKTGGRLFQANDRAQLADAFAKIAQELRYQYSIGYYPQTALQSGERRVIKVRVDQPNLAVRARETYTQKR